LAALAIACLRFLWLTADFLNFSRWMLDQAKYTDEGWWTSAAVRYHTLGHWNLAGDYNPAVAAPVWPLLLSPIFHLTGVNIVGPRLLSVLFSVATLGILFCLVRRYSQPGSDTAASLAILLLASSPFAFVFSRLAILDTFVVFQFCLLMLLASYARERPLKILAVLVVLFPIFVLTKATAVMLLPTVGWLAWFAMKAGGATTKYRLAALSLGGILAALIFRAYVVLVNWRGYGEDYRDFFATNTLPDIAWGQTFATTADILKNCTLVDNILYPLSIVGVFFAALYLRSLWKNPLFVAACIAFTGQEIFLFATQGDYAPRYFLPMLVPVIVIVSFAVAELRARHPRLYLLAASPIAIALILNTATIVSMLHYRTFQLYNAAQSISRIVRADAQHSPLILGISASQISLMTGLPSINDVYGTESLDGKIAAYRPGWYLAWNGIGPGQRAALSAFEIERVAAYHVFDDDERNELILYRLASRGK
jgi:4-amino-4-deoxy-L-arabinose transferase-like glycosyltransferase